MNPLQLTMRELHWMSTGKGVSDWWHTALIVATVRNLMLGKNDKPTQPLDVHPMRHRIQKTKPAKPVSVSNEDCIAFEREMARVEGVKLAQSISRRGR